MLRALSIRRIVIVDALDLEFDQGLITLTGETGAGKSILLDALGLALLLFYMGYLTNKAIDVFVTSWERDSVSRRDSTP